MGKMGQMALEIDECTQILNELLKDLEKQCLPSNNILSIRQYKRLRFHIKTLKEALIYNWDLCDFVRNEIQDKYCKQLKAIEVHEDKLYKYKLYRNFYDELFQKFENLNISRKIDIGNNNTTEFLTKKIENLSKNKKDLETKLNKSSNQNNLLVEQRNELEFKKLQIENELQKFRNKLKINENEKDIKENWQNKIEETFKTLKRYLKPIIRERNRLIFLYWLFFVLIVISLIIIYDIESSVICKLKEQSELPKLKEYLEIIFPLPIVGLLLWGFIAQMNRAQRQLVVLAKSIHKVEYIQGLLLSINSLSQTVEDGVSRINAALDRLIENHLNDSDVKSEVDLLKEENKDSLPFNSVLKLIKECKDLSKK
ncbi:hypothetical protein E0494_10130 [Marinilabiliaceae bacterium JC040]|nr:hypothetical protein [Marinilabiliaceae bacterium JC040]